MQALLDLNIIYKSKYFDILHIEHGLYAKHVLKPYIDDIRSSMSKRDLIGYRLFVRAGKGIALGSRYSGFPVATELSSKPRGTFLWTKASPEWEFSELYYPDVPGGPIGPVELTDPQLGRRTHAG